MQGTGVWSGFKLEREREDGAKAEGARPAEENKKGSKRN